jgi:hypothetical protein
MAEPQLVIRRGPSTVIQGTRERIVAELEKLGNDIDEITLIVPGKPVETNDATPPRKRKSFEEVFGPLQKGFDEGGMTDDELGEFIDAEITAYRAERSAKGQS